MHSAACLPAASLTRCGATAAADHRGDFRWFGVRLEMHGHKSNLHGERFRRDSLLPAAPQGSPGRVGVGLASYCADADRLYTLRGAVLWRVQAVCRALSIESCDTAAVLGGCAFPFRLRRSAPLATASGVLGCGTRRF